MPGNIKLRHYSNAPIASVGNDLAHLVLRIEETIGAERVQFGKLPALDAKALVLCQVPVKNVQLYCRHGIEVPFENLHRLVVPANIDEQASPWKTRLILDLDSRQIISVAITPEQLQESLKAS